MISSCTINPHIPTGTTEKRTRLRPIPAVLFITIARIMSTKNRFRNACALSLLFCSCIVITTGTQEKHCRRFMKIAHQKSTLRIRNIVEIQLDASIQFYIFAYLAVRFVFEFGSGSPIQNESSVWPWKSSFVYRPLQSELENLKRSFGFFFIFCPASIIDACL